MLVDHGAEAGGIEAGVGPPEVDSREGGRGAGGGWHRDPSDGAGDDPVVEAAAAVEDGDDGIRASATGRSLSPRSHHNLVAKDGILNWRRAHPWCAGRAIPCAWGTPSATATATATS